jgi:hypothetical protein
MKFIADSPGPRNYPYWPVPDKLKKYGSLDDIEEIVTRLEASEGTGTLLAGLREAVCALFDSIRTNNASLYQRLASEVIQDGDVVITFNYDVSLDRELRKAGKWEISNGYGFDLGISDMPKSGTKLLKLHGSTNWMDSSFGGIGAGTFSQGFGWNPMCSRPVLLPREFGFLGYEGVTDPEPVGGVTRSGSMVLMSRNKRFYVSTSINPREREPFWSTLWGQADTALRNANEVVIIGYSLPDADAEARRLLLGTINRDSSLTICCGQNTDRVGNEFVRGGFSQVCTDSKRFEHWLAAQCLRATSTAKCA